MRVLCAHACLPIHLSFTHSLPQTGRGCKGVILRLYRAAPLSLAPRAIVELSRSSRPPPFILGVLSAFDKALARAEGYHPTTHPPRRRWYAITGANERASLRESGERERLRGWAFCERVSVSERERYSPWIKQTLGYVIYL